MKVFLDKSFPGGFTVLMAVYRGDHPKLFERAVESVFANTILPKELLLVVDGPLTLELEGKLQSLGRRYCEKLNVIRLEKNVGLAKALNYGLNYVSTSWIVRADADDVNLKHRFSTLAKLIFEHPSLDLVGSAILEVDDSGVPLAKRVLPTSKGKIKAFARRRNPFNHMTVAFRLEIIRSLGGYPNIYLKEDYGLWCKCLAADVSMANTEEILVLATTGQAMYKRRGGWRYVQSEYFLQKLMVNLKLKTLLQAICDGFVRAIFFLIPARLRGFCYLRGLRTPIDPS